MWIDINIYEKYVHESMKYASMEIFRGSSNSFPS